MECHSCLNGDKPKIIDEDGTYSSVSGKPGLPGHALGDAYTHCVHVEKPLEDCPVCGPPPRRCLCTHPDWCHDEEGCHPGEDDCDEECIGFRDDGQPSSWV